MSALRSLVPGLGLGLALGFIGFSSWDEVHRMFLFADLRLLLTFGGGALATGLFLWWVRRSGEQLPARPIHRGTIVGGVLFGTGWALSGACPGIAFVQVGEGQLLAVITIAGMVLGNATFALTRRRLQLPAAPSCAD